MVRIQSRFDDEVRRRRPPNTNQVLRHHNLRLLHGHRPHKFLRFSFHFLDLSSSHCFVTAFSQHQGFFVAQPAVLARPPHRRVDQSSQKNLFCQIFLQIISNDLYTIAFTICGDKSVGVYLRPRSACKFVCSCPCSSQLPSFTIASLFSLGAKWGQCGITVLLTQTCYPSF
jgi:hypothetical protein